MSLCYWDMTAIGDVIETESIEKNERIHNNNKMLWRPVQNLLSSNPSNFRIAKLNVSNENIHCRIEMNFSSRNRRFQIWLMWIIQVKWLLFLLYYYICLAIQFLFKWEIHWVIHFSRLMNFYWTIIGLFVHVLLL